MPLLRTCTVCGTLTPGHRCPQHARRPHTSPEWQAYSKSVLAAWRLEHGNYCPGDAERGHAPHPCNPRDPRQQLTVDHPIAISNGGSMYGQQPRVLCRSANSSKGAR